MARERIEVEKLGEEEYEVRIADAGAERPASRHRVTVAPEHREEYGPGAEPERLVEESFRFLLEREPKEAILSRFALPTIERYFPEYRDEIRRRLGVG